MTAAMPKPPVAHDSFGAMAARQEQTQELGGQLQLEVAKMAIVLTPADPPTTPLELRLTFHPDIVAPYDLLTPAERENLGRAQELVAGIAQLAANSTQQIGLVPDMRGLL